MRLTIAIAALLVGHVTAMTAQAQSAQSPADLPPLDSAAVHALPAARWVTITSTSTDVLAADLESKRREGSNWLIWMRTQLAQPVTVSGGTMQTLYALQRVDCGGKRMQLVKSVRVVDGKLVSTPLRTTPFSPINMSIPEAAERMTKLCPGG